MTCLDYFCPMKVNMGTADRVIRVLVAIVLLIVYYEEVVMGAWGVVMVVLAYLLVLTALLSSCPVYSLLRLRTGANKG
jgi:Protein of unknown function (DUF2892)